jgi:protein gp37
MAENGAIQWTDNTFNPWIGCTKVSSGCDNCYAETWANRYPQFREKELWSGNRHRTSAAEWRKPVKWNRAAAASGNRARVFCSSLADVFDNQAPAEWRADLWALIRATPALDWQLLTKRPQNIAKMLPADWGDGWPNVWIGTTAENCEEAARRIPVLLRVPAVVRFVSAEPLLEDWADMLPGFLAAGRLHWLICGGESGPGFRDMPEGWARNLRDACGAGGCAFFMKQLAHGRAEPPIPTDLLVRQYPATRYAA